MVNNTVTREFAGVFVRFRAPLQLFQKRASMRMEWFFYKRRIDFFAKQR
jgi:hypothetical protein